ncbi:FAD-dependent oxidoreductase [Yeosuana marina]|uniref:NAD(P)/FAD-dependent oxidoreductase n=1 Tax=Yeosuana marina TaxID=1565536 RepID=UPI0030C8747F
MGRQYDIIVIGAGIYGSTSSFFLKNEKNKVLLIEKGKVGSCGATRYSRGIVRVTDPDIYHSQISYASIIDFLKWKELKYPGNSPFMSSGFLYLMEEQKLPNIENVYNFVDSNLYPINVLSKSRLRQIAPWLNNFENKVGIYERFGGYGSPTQTATNFMQGFLSKGGELFDNCRVLQIHPGKSNSWDVHLSEGILNTKVLLITTGAFTNELLKNLPIYTRSISLVHTNAIQRRIPFPIVDEAIETYIIPGFGKSYYAGNQKFEKSKTPMGLDYDCKEGVNDAVERINKLLMPSFVGTPLNCVTGFDAYTKIKRPIVQFSPNHNGLYIATGFSGRGYKCCISVSKHIAAEINGYLEEKSVVNPIAWSYKLPC